MKILITSNNCWNVINFRKGLVKKLVKNINNEIIVLSKRDSYTKSIQSLGCEFYNININQRGIFFINEIILIIKYYIYLIKIKPDIVLSFTIKPNLYTSIICNLRGIKNICNITGLGFGFQNIILKNFLIFLSKISIKKSSFIFFQNKNDLNFFRQNKILNKKYEVIPGSGIKIEKFKRKIKKIMTHKFLYVGRLIPDKGIKELVEAFETLLFNYPDKKIELILVGRLQNDLSSEILKKKIKQIKIKNFSDNLKQYFLNADYFIFPSYREGMSRALLQAGIFELPVICSNVVGNNNLVVNNKNGILFKSKSVNDLYKGMKKIIHLDKSKLNIMSKNLKKTIKKNYDEKIVINSYLRIIKQLYET